MKQSITILAAVLLLAAANAAAQTDTASGASVQLLPAGLTFAPLRAGLEEPRIGLFKSADASDMRVDIGNAADVVSLSNPSAGYRLDLGIDFFAYARVTGTENLRLQIDALDGFFGGHCSAGFGTDPYPLQLRLRLLHHSAHLADGHYANGGWIDNDSPIPFTQDYGELIVSRTLPMPEGILRLYGGGSYSTLVRPVDFRRWSGSGGCEASTDRIFGTVRGIPLNLYLAWHIALTGTPAYAASHQVQLGLKLGEYGGRGPTLYVGYYNGQSMFGEYYSRRVTSVGTGFTVDLY